MIIDKVETVMERLLNENLNMNLVTVFSEKESTKIF